MPKAIEQKKPLRARRVIRMTVRKIAHMAYGQALRARIYGRVLTSEASSYVTGQNPVVNGRWVAC
jgi:hypothetical protein